MSTPSFARQAIALCSGRWQIPVALAALVAATATLYQLMPRGGVENLGSLLAEVAALEEGGAPATAADALANLLELDPPLPAAQRADLHDRLADLIYRIERRRGTPNVRNVRLLLEHHDAASKLSYPPSSRRSLRVGQASEWIGNSARAISAYRAVLEQEPLPEQRREAMQGLVRLLRDQPESLPERERMLEGLLADEGVSAGYLWWAMQQVLQSALDENDTIRARLVLAKHGHRLKSSDLKGYWDYLWAWVMVHEGRPEEAEPLVQWINDWLGERSVSGRELDNFGHLPAMNRWLLGRIHLAEHRPQAALTAFEEALVLNPHADLFVAATAGKAQALAKLERHAAAQELYHEAVVELGARPSERKHGVERLRQSLLTLYAGLNEAQEYGTALDYLVLAAELTPAEWREEQLAMLEKLGQACQDAVGTTDDPERQRQYLTWAGQYLDQAAELCREDESRYAGLLWSSAQLFDEAGQIADVRRMLLSFLAGRISDPRLPRVFLQVGRTFEADGQLTEALLWYGRLLEQFPKLEEASRARLYRARCLLVLGQEAEAEQLLGDLLEDDNIAPQAMVFHDGLLELCDLLYQRGRYAKAIGRLEDFAALYPDDPERYRSRFMLADAYRRSAYALRDNPPDGVDQAAAQATSRARFRQAAELFAALLTDLGEESERDESLELYDRLSLFYRGDALFELNEPDLLAEALEIYRQAAARYEREPPALTAQVQIANIHLRMGRLSEAARAVERARWLLRSIPDEAFAAHPDGTDRAHWERYLTAISSSELFQSVFAAKP